MGTQNQATALKKEITDICEKLGWSLNDLAEIIYTAENDTDNETEMKRFQETFKKQFQRSTTKPKRLERYLEIITDHEDYERLWSARNVHVPLGYISESLSEKMQAISKEVTEHVKNQIV